LYSPRSYICSEIVCGGSTRKLTKFFRKVKRIGPDLVMVWFGICNFFGHYPANKCECCKQYTELVLYTLQQSGSVMFLAMQWGILTEIDIIASTSNLERISGFSACWKELHCH